MDAFDFGNVKAEKTRAKLRYNLLTSIAKMLRIVEICLALLLLSWIVTQLPFAFKISGDYIRKLSGFIKSPLFVFMISNAIIATLMAKSGRISGQNSTGDNAGTELCEELLKNRAERRESPSQGDAPPRVAEEVEYQDKQIISETNATYRPLEDQTEIETRTDTDSDDDEFPKVYRRTQSEKMNGDSVRPKLRRSETEIGRENARSGENSLEKCYPQDKLSNEEFQKTIEEFIAKQMRFLREESLAIVVDVEKRGEWCSSN
ncbi:hypothetical protein L6164_020074 [Bauhinia variegata]|uniref:Uncharacterized protein n=1 Tax=Bauhinia variegata TaxID=167791 RepID=A0ACB9MU76_BAUVA|nr:hypothetical protein L6164_020074 [Bauhinia variegata]